MLLYESADGTDHKETIFWFKYSNQWHEKWQDTKQQESAQM